MRKYIAITYVGFFTSLLILLGMAFNFYNRQTHVNRSIAWIEHTHETLREIETLENNFKQTESSQRGYLLTGDSVFLRGYNQSAQNVKNSFQQLIKLLKDNKEQRGNLKKMNFLIARRLDILDDGFVLYNTDKKIFHKRLKEDRDIMIACERILLVMEKEELRLLAYRRKSKDIYEDASSTYSAVTFLFAFVVFVVTFLLIIRELTWRLKYQGELEQKITELNQTNSELEQIAFVASHDLQEPLRKIRTFSDMLRVKFSTDLPVEGLRVIERMENASIRMQGLVEDLMNFTRLVSTNEQPQRVSLKALIEEVQNDMQEEFLAKGVTLSIDHKLPTITGYRAQLYLLFEALLDNAVKFAKEGTSPAIFILTQDAIPAEMKKKFNTRYDQQHYTKVIVRDNGIGFDNAFGEKMFVLFQRLHAQNSDYDGKGIGLSIVKRIMTNHTGYVAASGTVGEGAEFTLYFPVIATA